MTCNLSGSGQSSAEVLCHSGEESVTAQSGAGHGADMTIGLPEESVPAALSLQFSALIRYPKAAPGGGEAGSAACTARTLSSRQVKAGGIPGPPSVAR